jgi:hypothetical protein
MPHNLDLTSLAGTFANEGRDELYDLIRPFAISSANVNKLLFFRTGVAYIFWSVPPGRISCLAKFLGEFDGLERFVFWN